MPRSCGSKQWFGILIPGVRVRRLEKAALQFGFPSRRALAKACRRSFAKVCWWQSWPVPLAGLIADYAHHGSEPDRWLDYDPDEIVDTYLATRFAPLRYEVAVTTYRSSNPPASLVYYPMLPSSGDGWTRSHLVHFLNGVDVRPLQRLCALLSIAFVEPTLQHLPHCLG